jgi:hypothetical protein
MTLNNYDNEVLSCRGEAAGPITAGLGQVMRRGWSFESGSTCKSLSNRPSETGIWCTAEGFPDRPQLPAYAILAYSNGVAEKPWGKAIFPCATRRSGQHTHTSIGESESKACVNCLRVLTYSLKILILPESSMIALGDMGGL